MHQVVHLSLLMRALKNINFYWGLGVGYDDTMENNRDDLTFVVVVSSIPRDQAIK